MQNLLRCSWSPNGMQVAAGSADKFVHVWDVNSRRILYKLPGHTGSVNEVVFHPREPIREFSCSTVKNNMYARREFSFSIHSQSYFNEEIGMLWHKRYFVFQQGEVIQFSCFHCSFVSIKWQAGISWRDRAMIHECLLYWLLHSFTMNTFFFYLPQILLFCSRLSAFILLDGWLRFMQEYYWSSFLITLWRQQVKSCSLLSDEV